MVIIADTNLFHGRIKIANPIISALMEKLKILGWTFAVPEPSVLEMENGALDEYDKAHGALRHGIKSMNKLLMKVETSHISREEFLEQYKERWQEFIKKYTIQIIPFPVSLPDTKTLFSLGVEKAPPFDSTGNSYRDVIIFYAVKEFAESNDTEKFYFITNDHHFVSAVNQISTKNLSCGKQEQVTKVIEETLSSTYRKRESRLKEEVLNELSGQTLAIEELVKNDIEFDISNDFLTQVLSIDSFGLKDVVQVNSVADAEDNKLTFFATAIGEVAYQVETTKGYKDARIAGLTLIANKPSKVGDTARPSQPDLSLLFGSARSDVNSIFQRPDPNPFEKIIETRRKFVTIEIEGEGILQDDSIKDLRVTFVDFSDQSPFRFIDFDGTRRTEPLPPEDGELE